MKITAQKIEVKLLYLYTRKAIRKNAAITKELVCLAYLEKSTQDYFTEEICIRNLIMSEE